LIDVSDDDVRPWLNHVELIVPDAKVRAHFLDWMASVVQRQNEKPNHGVVIGGKHGIGKSMLIEPFRVAIGLHNVQESFGGASRKCGSC
jgi:predicted ATPase